MLLAVLLTACSPKIYPTQLKEDVIENVVDKEVPRDTVVVIKPLSCLHWWSAMQEERHDFSRSSS